MKIKINIEKKHLYYLTALISLLLIGLVIADGWTSGEPFHETLYTDKITSKGSGNVIVDDNLDVTGAIGLSVTNKLTTRELDVIGAFSPKITVKYFKKDSNCGKSSGCKAIDGEWSFCALAKKSFNKCEWEVDDWCHCSVHVGQPSDEKNVDDGETFTYTGNRGGWQVCHSSGKGWNCDCDAVCIKFE